MNRERDIVFTMNRPILTTLLITLSLPLSGMDTGDLEKADKYFEATLFDQAEELYLEALRSQPDSSPNRAHIKRQLARSYYIKKQYQNIISLFSGPDQELTIDEASDPCLESLFLVGVSFNRLQMYERSTYPLEYFLKMKRRPQEIYADEAWFELGLAHFQQNQFKKSKEAFEKIKVGRKPTKHYALGQLYLARIAMIEDDTGTSRQIMQELQELPIDFAPYAAQYINGELHFRENDWENAATAFEDAAPPQAHETLQWHSDALYYLGLCYLYLGKDTGKLHLVQQAAALFHDLEERNPSEKTRLSLGQALLATHLISPDEAIVHELNQRLGPKIQWKSRNNKHEALLILAESAPEFTEKKQLYRQIVHETFSTSPLYSKAWYIRGLGELEEGEKLNEDPRTRKEAGKLFEQAIASLNKAFDLLYPEQPKTAAHALKQQIYANYYLQNREGLLNSLSIISRLLNQYRNDLFPQLAAPDEIYFLQGLVASQLLDCEERETFFTIAENSLTHCIESYPKGGYQPKALHLLGTLYLQNNHEEKAERTFLELAQLTPPTSFTGEAWYWAAESAEKLLMDQKVVQERRKRVFEHYPRSPFADTAYFRYFSYNDYLSGHPDAVKHLESLSARYPNSPYLMNASYLLGLEAMKERKSPNGKTKKNSDPERAAQYFENAARLYDRLPIPESKRSYFSMVRYRSLIEQSKAYLAQGKDQESIGVLREIYVELKNNGENKVRIDEEAAYLLVKGYLDQNQNNQAASVLSEVLEKFHLTKTTRGYYLSRAWYQRGILAMRQGDPLYAGQCFKHAEDAAKGKVLSTDELLDLWILQSISCQEQGKMDEAMLVLSKVINYDAVSSERLRAMFLRAEIYESQGRTDLARRQLQATASKGGPWSLKAKEKLDKYYGYQ